MADRDFDQTDPARLADLLRVSDSSDPDWRPEELAGVLRHQLSVPLDVELGVRGELAAGPEERPPSPGAGRLTSFADLLAHPSPPVAVLVETKEFAKACCERPDAALPAEISAIMYYASIAAALVRCGQRITSLDDTALLTGLGWALEQEWLIADLRPLFEQASERLSGEAGRRE